MVDYTALKALWPTLTGTTDQNIEAVNAMTVAGPPKDVPAQSVYGYLALVGKLVGLKAYADTPAATQASLAAQQFFYLINLPTFETFSMSDPNVYASVQGWLGAWAADPTTKITAQDAAVILQMASTAVPWWSVNGLTGPISTPDLVNAGGLS